MTGYLAARERVITFEVPGRVVGKGRPRFVRATGRAYTPAATVAYENLIALCATGALLGLDWPTEGQEYALSFTAYLRKNKTGKRAGRMRKLDTDNITKAIGDALNGIAWADDDDIVQLDFCEKVPLEEGEERLVVTIERWEAS